MELESQPDADDNRRGHHGRQLVLVKAGFWSRLLRIVTIRLSKPNSRSIHSVFGAMAKEASFGIGDSFYVRLGRLAGAHMSYKAFREGRCRRRGW